MPNDKPTSAPASVEGVTDAPGSELDELTPEELAQLAKDRKLSSENMKLRRSRNEAWAFLGVKSLEEFEALKAKRAAEPEPSDEPAEPAPASNGAAAKDLAIWKLTAKTRSVDPEALAAILAEAVSAVSESGECLDSDGAVIEPTTLRQALPRLCAPTAPGVMGGSGGRSPLPLPQPAPPESAIEKSIDSQAYYERNRAKVLAEERTAHAAK